MEYETTIGIVDCLDGNPDTSRIGVLLADLGDEQDELEEWTVIDNDTDN